MKRIRLRLTIMTAVMLLTVGMLSFPATTTANLAADCSIGGQVAQEADDKGDEALNNCCDVFGCPPFEAYCEDRYDEAYNAHVVSKGCLNLII